MRKRKEQLNTLERKIQLNMDLDTSKDVELTSAGVKRNY
jgi:hypothetical protein